MVDFITGVTAAEDWRNGFYRQIRQRQKMHGPWARTIYWRRWRACFKSRRCTCIWNSQNRALLSTKMTLLWIFGTFYTPLLIFLKWCCEFRRNLQHLRQSDGN